jgi:DNA-directed RNA polymerase specialized sigma24 family protein
MGSMYVPTGLCQKEYEALFEELGPLGRAARSIARKFEWRWKTLLERARFDTEDFVQDLLTAVVDEAPGFKPSEATSFTTYSYNIMTKKALDIVRLLGRKCRHPGRLGPSLDSLITTKGGREVTFASRLTDCYHRRHIRRPTLPARGRTRLTDSMTT